MLKGKNKQRGGALIGLIFVVVLVAAIYFGSSFFLKEETPSEKSLQLLKEAQERAAQYNQRVEDENEEIAEMEEEKDTDTEEEETSKTQEINPEDIDVNSSDWQELVRESENIKIKFHKYWYYTVNHNEAAQNGYNVIIGFGPNSDIWEELPPYTIELVIAPENIAWDYAGYMKKLEDKDGKTYVLRAEDEAYADLIDSMADTFEFIN
jgi:hypothetical protein